MLRSEDDPFFRSLPNQYTYHFDKSTRPASLYLFSANRKFNPESQYNIQFITPDEFHVDEKKGPSSGFKQSLKFIRLKQPSYETETISFPFIFSGKEDRVGDFEVRKINSVSNASIHAHIEMKEDRALRPIFENTSTPITLDLSQTQKLSSVWIEDFQFYDGFQWNHFQEQRTLVDYWKAISGTITFNTSESEHDGYYASVFLSNVVFQSSETQAQTTLDSISFTNVYVGW